MIKIKIFTVSKHKHAWLEEALSSYEKRLRSFSHITWQLFKSEKDLEKHVEREKNFICLDPTGVEYTSEQFAQFINQNIEQKGPKLSFVIGGANGLLNETKDSAEHIISLSKLTFTHQMTRLILIEQLYRSFEIARNSPYHK